MCIARRAPVPSTRDARALDERVGVEDLSQIRVDTLGFDHPTQPLVRGRNSRLSAIQLAAQCDMP